MPLSQKAYGMLRSLQEVEKELDPGFLLYLHDNGWAFSSVDAPAKEDALPNLLPYDSSVRYLLKVQLTYIRAG